MPAFAAYLLVIGAGYLLGSLPFAVLIARSRGADIFKVGSGNPGATNVLRSLGRGPGYLCFFLDALKGAAAAACGFWLARHAGQSPDALALAGVVAAIIGHSASLFLRFRGGKGVATTIGGLLVILNIVVVAGLGVWLIVFLIWRYVSLASLAFAVSLPLFALASPVGNSTYHVALCVFVAAFIFYRHRENIQRLRAGTERRSR